MTRLKLAVNRRKYGIYLSLCIACGIVGFLLGNWFNANYQIQPPIIRRAMLSPVKIANAASSAPADVLKAPQKQEASVVVPNYGTGADLKSLVLSYFPPDQRDAVDKLVMAESSWNQYAVNKSSGACGLFQSINCDYDMSNSKEQASWGEAYIRSRYGDANKAWAFWQAHNWY